MPKFLCTPAADRKTLLALVFSITLRLACDSNIPVFLWKNPPARIRSILSLYIKFRKLFDEKTRQVEEISLEIYLESLSVVVPVSIITISPSLIKLEALLPIKSFCLLFNFKFWSKS